MHGMSMITEKTRTTTDQVHIHIHVPPFTSLYKLYCKLWCTYLSFLLCLNFLDVFDNNQQYITFLLENSGMQLGSYVVSYEFDP